MPWTPCFWFCYNCGELTDPQRHWEKECSWEGLAWILWGWSELTLGCLPLRWGWEAITEPCFCVFFIVRSLPDFRVLVLLDTHTRRRARAHAHTAVSLLQSPLLSFWEVASADLSRIELSSLRPCKVLLETQTNRYGCANFDRTAPVSIHATVQE